VDYVEPGGESVTPDAFKIPKARELAAFLAALRHPYARLLETRRIGSQECVVVELTELEVGQAPVVALLDAERFACLFSESDEFVPSVLALRKDFPDAAHINLTNEEIPRSLCLYEAPYSEVKLSWTAGRFIERIRWWIRDTARGSLHREDQPLEPVLLASGLRLILPVDLFSETEDETPAKLLIYGGSDSPAGKVLCATRAERATGEERQNAVRIVCTLVACKPRVHRIRRVPTSLVDLHDLHAEAGRDLIADLRTRFQTWDRASAPLSSNLLIVSSFPRIRDEGAEPEASDIWAFLCPTVVEIGEGLGIWERQGKIVGAVINGQPDQTRLKALPVNVLNPSFELSRKRAAASSAERPSSVRVVAIGAGTLGSQVLPLLVCTGFGTWTVVDKDVLLPHNGARHEIPSFFAGMPKAELVARRCNQLLAGETTCTAIVGDVLKPGSAINEALSQAEVIADFSASVAAARGLSNHPSTARRLSAFMSPSGADLILLVEDSVRSIPLDQLEMQYYRALIRDNSLGDHLRPPGQVRYAHSCRDVSATVSADLVAMQAAIAARGLREALGQEQASISLWLSDKQRNVHRLNVSPKPVFEAVIEGWRLSWDSDLVETLVARRSAALPRETGGVLIGHIDTDKKRVYVTDSLPSPVDSQEWPTLYIRGAEGLEEQVTDISRKTAGMLQYVGEWHSHPDGYSARPSATDLQALAKLTSQMAVEGLPAILHIIGQDERIWVISSL
jgi:integrative and conjugative element protein (TIGR02256 family)